MRKRVLQGAMRDDSRYPLRNKERYLKTLRPIKTKVLVELIFNVTSELIYLPKHMERTTMSRVLSVGPDVEDLKPQDIIIHGNRAGHQFSFINDPKSQKYRIVPYRIIQAIIKK